MGDDEEYELNIAGPVKARKLDFLIVGVDLLRELAGAAEKALSNAEMLLCSHANYLTEQRQFADQARLEIESLTKE